MLQVIKRFRWGIALVMVLLAAAIAADYVYRCKGPPLTKEEAAARAETRLKRYRKSFNVWEEMKLTEASYDGLSKAWLFTYKGTHCTVIVVVDRCFGDDVNTNACSG